MNPQAMNPSAIQEAFSRDGFAGLFEISDKFIIQRLRSLYERRGHEFLWSKRNQHVILPEVASAGTCADILHSAAAILGHDLLLWLGHLLPRNRDDGRTASYRCHWDGLNNRFGGVHVSVAVTDMSKANGCLWLIPGSNRWSRRRRILTVRLVNRSPLMRRFFLKKFFKPLELRSGQFFLMHGATVHLVLPNQTNETRLALVLRYCKPSTVVRNVPKSERQSFNRQHSPLVDDNQDDLIPCLLARGEDRFRLNDVKEVPLMDET